MKYVWLLLTVLLACETTPEVGTVVVGRTCREEIYDGLGGTLWRCREDLVRMTDAGWVPHYPLPSKGDTNAE